jgi:hypothetical protein
MINIFMCVIAVKYLPEIGWIGVKNRDRGYYPEINIRKSTKHGIERCYIWDANTKYTEGVNEHGVSIISASMATISDEKGAGTTTHEGTNKNYMSPDGKKIRTALLEKTCKSALECLVEKELTGHTFVFNENECYILESGYRNGTFVYKIQEIQPNQVCVRTNHGILLPWAGYQRVQTDPSHSRKRVSSEVRKIKSELGMIPSKTVKEALNSIMDHSEPNPQLNPCRIDDRDGYMKTTGQIAIVPKHRKLYYRPIWSALEVDFNKINHGHSKTFFEVIDVPADTAKASAKLKIAKS